MAAHHQLIYHIVFSTKERRPLLKNDQFRQNVWAYMAGVARNLDGLRPEVHLGVKDVSASGLDGHDIRTGG
ncbi:MAG: hypothetical protein CMJ78_10080 [Planctomycetaceae bacterium]|nr:hypothetical protein [Planctomycetaceae bacterium]